LKEKRDAKAAKKRKAREEKQSKVWRLQCIRLQHRNWPTGSRQRAWGSKNETQTFVRISLRPLRFFAAFASRFSFDFPSLSPD
jgi:hypothetical protein